MAKRHKALLSRRSSTALREQMPMGLRVRRREPFQTQIGIGIGRNNASLARVEATQHQMQRDMLERFERPLTLADGNRRVADPFGRRNGIKQAPAALTMRIIHTLGHNDA
jgi:hypothetical protein